MTKPRPRDLTEDDVTAALKASYVPELMDIEPAKLLELFNLLLDRTDVDEFVSVPRMEM
jgi:hypothetical protein